MDRTVLDWLLEDKNPEVKLRTLKEYEHYPEDNEKVIACKKEPSIEFRNSLYAGIQSRKCRRREQVGNILRIHGAGIGSKHE